MPEARAKARELEPRRKDESTAEKKHRKAVVKDAKVRLPASSLLKSCLRLALCNCKHPFLHLHAAI